MPRSSTTWQPGQSGNPAGKPKGHKAIATLVTEQQHLTMVQAAVTLAEEGDMAAFREIFSRVEPAVKIHELSVESVRSHLETVLSRLVHLIPEDRRDEAFALLEDPGDGPAADAPIPHH